MPSKPVLDLPTPARGRLAYLALAACELARRLVGLPHIRAVYRGR